MASVEVLQAVAVTAELCGLTLSEPAARIFVGDLEAYPEPQVMQALGRCRREVRGRLTVNDVISRINDGRPGPDEAWALIPKDEYSSTVWTAEMATAWGVACHAEPGMAQRMAFREAYIDAVSMARDSGIQPQWTASLGWSEKGRESAVLLALEKGRITPEYAGQFMPLPAPSPKVIDAIGPASRNLIAANQKESA